MREINFNDAQQAIAFLTPQLLRIEAEVYEMRYPAFDYASLMFVNTEGDMWDAGVVFYSGDIAGKAEFLSAKGFDMPYADTSLDVDQRSTHLAGIGYEWSRGELERAARMGRNLTADKALAASRVAERFIYGCAVIGHGEKGWYGLINQPGVPVVVAPVDFATGTPEQILAVINGAITAPTIATNGAYNANALLLPDSAIRDLGSRLIANTTTTLLSFIQANNVLTASGRGTLTIRGMAELETAGAGGTRRMVAYDNGRDAEQFHLPGPHTFLDPFRKASMTFEVAGIMNLGGHEQRIPKAKRYTDGI
jgi:hypothetical protein